MPRHLSLVLVFGLCVLLPGRGLAQPLEGSNESSKQTLSPYFLVEGAGDGVEPFALEATLVKARIDGVIADVTVEQHYRNGGTLPLNTHYIFPASTRAAVHGLQMRVGDKRVRAQIRQREQAQREFREAAESGKTASLLQQARPNVFSMDLANVLPGDQIIVELHYTELLVGEEGRYEFVYPTVVGPRYAGADSGPSSTTQHLGLYMPKGDSPDSRFALELALAGAVPLSEVESPSHKLEVAFAGPSSAQVSLAKNQGFGGNRDFILRYRLAGERLTSGLLLHEGPQENHFLLMMQPPARVTKTDIPAREYIFVLDVSGSMRGFPLDTAKRVLARLAAGMRETDSFNVLLFSGDSRLLSERSLPATQANVHRALALIDSEDGGGGTELQAALERALELPRSAQSSSRSIVVVTDGYIAQERGAFELIERNLAETNVFAFGIGSSVNRYLIEGIARAGRAEPFVVTNPNEAETQADKFRRYIDSPVLTQVRVQFHGLEVYDIEPLVQPDLFAERPVVVFGKWRGPKHGTVELTGQSATGSVRHTLNVTDFVANTEHPALAQLWARSRIARLHDFAGQGDDAEPEITALGLRYSLLTPYTSFIAVLEQVRNPLGGAVDSAVPLPLPQGMAGDDCGAYAAGAEPELYALLALALGIVAAVSMRRRALREAR